MGSLGFEVVEECGATEDEIVRYLQSPTDVVALRAKVTHRRRWLLWHGVALLPISRWHG
jgi:hypothetical protein